MASGRFGKATPLANTNIDLYTCPAGQVATVTVAVCNRAASDAKVSVGVRGAGAVTDGDWIECDATLPANGVIERTGIVLSAGESIVVRANSATVNFRAHGFEENA